MISEKILIFLSQNENFISQLINDTNASIEEIKSIINDNTKLAFIMDYMLHNEEILIKFLETNNIDYESFYKQRANLPGFINFG